MSEELERQRVDVRSLTPARVGLATTGVSVGTRDQLEFARAHALARDAVHARLEVAPMLGALRERGLEALAVKSAARDRAEYLVRPDLGRRLAAESEEMLTRAARGDEAQRVVVVICDGLSALAVERHAVGVVDALRPLLERDGWTIAPVVIAEQGRVALGDAVAQAVGAAAVVVLIGERPGLSSADSLGAYVTWRPGPATTDAERNCVSNIRHEGLGYMDAAERIAWYCREGRRQGRTGVELRADSQARIGDEIQGQSGG